MTYKEWITGIKNRWIGKTILYDGEQHTVVDVDYNGFLLIDKKTLFTDTTAVSSHSVYVIN